MSDLFPEIDIGPQPPSATTRWYVEDLLRGLGSMLDARHVLRDEKVVELVGGAIYFWTKHRTWFVYIDLLQPQAIKAALKAKKALIPRSKISSSGRSQWMTDNTWRLSSVGLAKVAGADNCVATGYHGVR